MPAGDCPKCGSRKIAKEQAGLVRRSQPKLASEIVVDQKEKIPSGLPLIDKLLSGGIVKGFSILLSGGPGVGKSTLLSQLIASYTHLYEKIGFYGTSEEEESDVAQRMRRLELPLDRTIVMADSVGEQFFSEMKARDPIMSIIDSVQAATKSGYAIRSLQGAAELVLSAHRFAHETQSIVIVSCHENKDGDAAGPLALIHYVDCAIQLELADTPKGFIRLATVLKNRKGIAPMQLPIEMTEKGLRLQS